MKAARSSGVLYDEYDPPPLEEAAGRGDSVPRAVLSKRGAGLGRSGSSVREGALYLSLDELEHC